MHDTRMGDDRSLQLNAHALEWSEQARKLTWSHDVL